MDLNRFNVMDLTTVGRVSGIPHTIEIWFAHKQEALYLLSGGGKRSDWVRNLLTDSRVDVRIGGARFTGRARLAVNDEEDRKARQAVFAKYSATYGGDLIGWRETALPIIVELDDGSER